MVTFILFVIFCFINLMTVVLVGYDDHLSRINDIAVLPTINNREAFKRFALGTTEALAMVKKEAMAQAWHTSRNGYYGQQYYLSMPCSIEQCWDKWAQDKPIGILIKGAEALTSEASLFSMVEVDGSPL